MSRNSDREVEDETILETTEGRDELRESFPSLTNISEQPLHPGQRSLTPDPAQADSNGSGLEDDEHESNTPTSILPAGHMLRVIPPKASFAPLPYSTSRTGLVYDSSMRFHVDQTETNDDAHPERPGRILQIFDEFVNNGLVPRPLEPETSEFQLKRIPTREATESELCLIHSRKHVEYVKSSEDWPLDEISERTRVGEGQSSIYWHNLTWLCAKLAAGGAIEAVNAVLSGSVKNAVAIVRPPGHHAEHDEPSGFCFFNNVPIATRVAQKHFPGQCRKVLILDWDVHHGNGIQHAFYNDPNVLYISLHVYKGGNFYPFSFDADHAHCGEGAGLGRNVNISWSEQGMTDADYMLAFQQVVMPICLEFDPDLVMISAGFDAADGDPLGGCYVTPACYSHMTHMLMQLAQGKVVACLEGGYNLQSISKSALAMTRTLMGEAPERMGDMTPSHSAVAVVQQVIRMQSTYWKCLYPKRLDLRLQSDSISERLHDVIRERQSKVLWDNFGMVSLFIRRVGISRSFKDQVLATQNFQEPRPLLLIFHDPPQATNISDRGITNVIELHNTLLTDSLTRYIEWAVKHDFAVIDVNIPKYITKDTDATLQVDAQMMNLDSDDERSRMCREVAKYIWENYLELGQSTHTFFMGVGESMLGLVDLLRSKGGCIEDVTTTIGFVAEQPILGVTHPDDDSVAKTYHERSLIFVADDHPVFQQNKKVKRRHGSLQRSPVTNLQEMLDEHRSQVFRRLQHDTQQWRDNRTKESSHEVGPVTIHSGYVDMDIDTEGSTRAQGPSIGALETTPAAAHVQAG